MDKVKKNDQSKVTKQLGYQVRRAVATLVRKFDKLSKDKDDNYLATQTEKQLYEAALTVMMRLVFLTCAEEKDLLPLSNTIYNNCYAVSTLRERLRKLADQYTEQALEGFFDAWPCLLATFRIVYCGVDHNTLYLPAHDSSLFDPDKYTFLEGRAPGTHWRHVGVRSLPIDNRTVLELLEALQVLEVKVADNDEFEARTLSFQSLDIEQIGHIYEGLLDYTAVCASQVMLGLKGTKDKETEVALSELQQLQQLSLSGKTSAALLDFLVEKTGRSRSGLEKDLNITKLTCEETSLFHLACDNNPTLWQAVQPFVGLLRKDERDCPVVFPQGTIYVTKGSNRRATGAHYTPRNLTELIVRYTLEPLVYEGPAVGLAREQWRLKSSTQLLQLKICDFAMGSGAFLVQTCRYLAEHLVAAWEQEGVQEGVQGGGKGENVNERVLIARRLIAERCLYGVDINPMAVEMAKLSLWLITMQKDRPFSFLNHALKCGDSLLGVTQTKQLIEFNLLMTQQQGEIFSSVVIKKLLQNALAKRQQLEAINSNSILEIVRKKKLLSEAEAAVNELRLIADLLIGQTLNVKQVKANPQQHNKSMIAQRINQAIKTNVDNTSLSNSEISSSELQALQQDAANLLTHRRPFHWLLEFPEVFLKEVGNDTNNVGFDAIISNPPFIGGQRITGTLGTDYRDFLIQNLGHGKRGLADLSAYFLLRTSQLLHSQGGFGLIATNTIAQGDTREVGLDQLISAGLTLNRAISSRKWPGSASLEVAYIWATKREWQGQYFLDDTEVVGITSLLTIPGKVTGKPYRLKANENKSFVGSNVSGLGFIMTPEQAQQLITKDPRNKDVLLPYLSGEDLNSRYDQSPSRWVINFQDWPLDRESAPADYDGPVAADYPDCLDIVREKVKPERLINNRKTRRQYWWRFGEICRGLYRAISEMKQVLAISTVTSTVAFSFVPKKQIYSDALTLLVSSNFNNFALIQSSFHSIWVWQYSSTLQTTLRYTHSDCFETFPFPQDLDSLEDIGTRYYNHRQAIMLERKEGLTKTYNRLHNPYYNEDIDPEIVKLRELQIEMDYAVAKAYGWNDLQLEHDFHDTKQGRRFTISETARRETLDRLLALNHERYAAEVAVGLHDSGKKAGKATKPQKSKNHSTSINQQVIAIQGVEII